VGVSLSKQIRVAPLGLVSQIASPATLRLADVPVTTVHYDGTCHEFMLLIALNQTKATRAAIAQATAFLREAFGTD
jgi:acetyl esterase